MGVSPAVPATSRRLRAPLSPRTRHTWTGVAMPESGEYLFSDALCPVSIDRELDLGTYFEPNVWMIHRGIGRRTLDR